MKFPDVIHAGKPEPDNEIPQAQSAHNNFWGKHLSFQDSM
jgi:catalase